MRQDQKTHSIQDIEFRVVYSRRRTLGISVLPDSTVVVRVPHLTSLKTINRIVHEKASWIIKHRDSYRVKDASLNNKLYVNGETHLFRGNESVLKIETSGRPNIRFYDSTIAIGVKRTGDTGSVKRLLYRGYKEEALTVFPEMMKKVLAEKGDHAFRPAGLIIRTMKRRWGSCSNKGIITLSTELIKLPDLFVEYVIIHELCHLKHHNHGAGYYKLLSEIFPEWKSIRKELRKYMQL